ncbi:serine hydrolase [uncultured Psychroserpens sp.]|uniref:serine hydrolase n=1 Tax=uncultured Psychroserpens sp. TaxID=255436 RepID=UPI00262BD323|nr:serine hydrolase [uncultured Psychroserpens sp.]
MKLTQIFTILFFISISSIAITQNQNQSSTLYSRIDNYLESAVKNGFTGAITVIKNESIVINKGYGIANKNTQTQNNPNTIFDIGSNTKQFTATAILKLIEMGKINENNPLSLFFKNLPVDKQNITIHQLLTHTSGFVDTIGNDFDEITSKQFFDTLFASKLLFSPGEKYEYSNVGYSVLGKIIELASGLEYEVFLSQNLFIPAGMKQTGYLLPKWNTKEISRSYNRGILESESPILKYKKNGTISWHLKANGGINSTQNDMILWYNALKSNTIISIESFEKMTTAYADYPNGTLSYGYGWTIRFLEGDVKRIAHNGSNGAYSHSLIWFPKKDIYIVYATNANSEKVEYIAYAIAKMLLDETYIPKPVENNVYAYAVNYMVKNDISKTEELITLLKEKYPDNFTSSRLLNSIGNILLMIDKHKDWVIALFKKNVQLYPNDGNLWDSLGDGYKANNQKEDAIKSYQKAIELGYEGSQKKINELIKN